MAATRGRPRKLTEKQVAELVRRWEAGASAAELSAAFGVSKGVIYRALREQRPARPVRRRKAYVLTGWASERIAEARRQRSS